VRPGQVVPLLYGRSVLVRDVRESASGDLRIRFPNADAPAFPRIG